MNVGLLAIGSVIVLCGRNKLLAWGDLWDWFRSKKPQGDLTLEGSVKPAIAVICRAFLCAWVGWFAFYIYLICHMQGGQVPLSMEQKFNLDLLQNFTTLWLVVMYFKLSAPNHRTVSNWEFRRVLLVGWLFVLLAITSYEYLVLFRTHVDMPDPNGAAIKFKVLYGFAQALALFIVVGRVENLFVSDHLQMMDKQSRTWPTRLFKYQALVLLCYAYAALQPLYPIFDQTEGGGQVALVWAALVGKAAFFCLFILVLARGKLPGAISPLEHYLYELERFTVEDMSSFERKFLMEHFRHLYRKRQHERYDHPGSKEEHALPFLGVEYAYLNDFKRMRLLPEAVQGGIWIKGVYPKADRSANALQFGDFVTEVDGIPLGPNNRLSDILRGLKPTERVAVTYWRRNSAVPIDPFAPIPQNAWIQGYPREVTLSSMDEVLHHGESTGSGVMLGLEFLYHHIEFGAVCEARICDKGAPFKYRLLQRPEDQGTKARPIRVIGIRECTASDWFCTPDVHMLRLYVERLDIGDRVFLQWMDLSAKDPEDLILNAIIVPSKAEGE